MQEEIHKELWNRDERNVHYIQKKLKINKQKIPDPKKHQIISFIKSGVRIVGYIFLPFSLEIATILLILSEIIGIKEELV